MDQEMIEAAAGAARSLRAKKLMLGLAESCTGGLVAAARDRNPRLFSGVRPRLRHLQQRSQAADPASLPATLERYGAVSRQTAEAMAKGSSRTRQYRSLQRSLVSPDRTAGRRKSPWGWCTSPSPALAQRQGGAS